MFDLLLECSNDFRVVVVIEVLGAGWTFKGVAYGFFKCLTMTTIVFAVIKGIFGFVRQPLVESF